MTLEYSLKTFADIYTAVLEHGRQSEDETVLINRIKRWINIRYMKVQGYAKWPWRKVEHSLYIPASYDGTSCSITNGSKELTVATVISEEVSNDWIDRRIIISNDKEIYKIVALQSYASGNCKFILNQVYVSETRAAVTFKVFKDEYAMNPDFSDFDDVVSFYQGKEVRRIGSDRIMQMYNANPKRSGRALYVSTVGTKKYEGVKLKDSVLGQSFLGGFSGSKRVKIYPAIYSEDYILPITYVQAVKGLVEDDDETLMQIEDNIILFYGALADLYSYLKDNDETNRFEGQFNDKLVEMLVSNKEDQDRPRFQPGFDYRNRNSDGTKSSMYEFDNSDFELT